MKSAALQWSEVDTASGQIRIPLGKMKSRRLHTVPLSGAAKPPKSSRPLRALTGSRPLLFPGGLQGTERPMSENTINAALRRLG